MGRKKMSDAARIRAYYEKNPGAKPQEVAKALNVKPTNVYLARSKMKQGGWKTLTVTSSSTPFNPVVPSAEKAELADNPWFAPAADPVNHPPHYKTGGIETIDFIEAKGLNYRLGNVIKYITRSDHKGNRKEDLQKALWYLQREIEKA